MKKYLAKVLVTEERFVLVSANDEDDAVWLLEAGDGKRVERAAVRIRVMELKEAQ